jgi:hypothetical protein
LIFANILKPNTLSFKERGGVRMGYLRFDETHPHLNPPLEGEDSYVKCANIKDAMYKNFDFLGASAPLW